DLPATEIADPALERFVLRKVLRTLDRLDRYTRIFNYKLLANILAKHSPHHARRLSKMSIYLELIAEAMFPAQSAARQCAGGGLALGFTFGLDKQGPVLNFHRTPRADALYCSPRCKQKAFRKRRVTTSPAPAMTEPLPRDASPQAREHLAVTLGAV